jgi:hypothetical protein
MALSLAQEQRAADHPGDPLPVLGFAPQLPSARGGDRIELRAAVVLGLSPFGADPALLYQPREAEIDRALVDAQRLLADLLDAQRQA